MFSPSLFGLIAWPESSSRIYHLLQIAGLLLMGGGLVLEALSDKQKLDFKAQFPCSRYCCYTAYLTADDGSYCKFRCG